MLGSVLEVFALYAIPIKTLRTSIEKEDIPAQVTEEAFTLKVRLLIIVSWVKLVHYLIRLETISMETTLVLNVFR